MRIPFVNPAPRVNVLRLQGAIGISGRGGAGLSDAGLAPLLERAFTKGKPKAVALAINSPGGSPVQSSLIAARIRRLAEKHEVPVHAFVEDVAASGGYWLATAADQIWADECSVVGSIGVISGGFGLQDFIARHGIERRVHTAGRSKSQLDMFRPENPEDVARLQKLLDEMHGIFIAQVRTRRGARLAESEDIFTGAFWLARRAQELGLIDGIAHLVPQMRALFGEKTRFQNFGQRRSLLRRVGLSGADLASDALAVAEERAAFQRFGA
ncbi:MAG TPA: S49 family peptidase [Paracoccus sp. (in: a-proteobacteria)]|uniref:S49 family peptidase n=1 Tax=uncultured Paracoccus sp. TaxID=189685 RepID=UPI002609EDA5|nr:S49 family peptidase [uncultured Paracoccus sp.]HMQ42103.1 S49 family peptidase [Paracoccus sp. (in: a-proteobacteria)]HMR37830.1 S49 family peptidase [Paracoccus sp. (in: a-proteobacteria)]